MLESITTLAEYSHILSTETRVCFIDFYATWCGPCKAITPFLERLNQSELSDYVRFIKVNVDDAEDIAAYCHVSAMPTFIAYKNGQKVGEITGANKKSIIALLSKATGIDIVVDDQ